jgi:hypothetical protein
MTSTSVARHVVTASVLLASLASCSTDRASAIRQAGTDTSSYIAAKRAYVASLHEAMRGQGVQEGPYKLVAVVGPHWPIGTVIDPTDPTNVQSTSCLYPEKQLPVAMSWADLPVLRAGRTVDFSAGLPSKILNFLGKSDKANLAFKSTQAGNFSLVEIHSVIVPADAFTASLTGACKTHLALNGGLVVRGIVTAKEVFSSGQKIEGDAGVTIVDDPLFTFRYASEKQFELSDKQDGPKMFMVAYFPPDTRNGEAPVFQVPTLQQIARLEALSAK